MDRHVGVLVSVALLVPVLLSAQKQTRLVFVNATDRAGAPIPDLTPADFELTAGGVKQPVTRVTFGAPMRVVILVDASGAMQSHLNSFRQGMNAFVDAMPPEPEIAIISITGQLGVRQAPTTDHAKLHTVIDRFASESGGNAFLDVLLEADKRFLKNAPDRWPVFVMVTTDSGEMRGDPVIEPFNAFAQDFRIRGGSAHGIVIHGQSIGLISQLTLNLVQNTGGIYEPLAVSTAVPDKMKALAARIAADRQAMVSRYAVEYTADAKSTSPVSVKVPREGVTVDVSPRRPF